jgi:hypothetical protein
MSTRHSIRIAGLLAVGILAFALSVAWAQDTSTPDSNAPTQGSAPSNGTPQDNTGNAQPPVPAYGQENAPPPITETPPLSGLDLPSLEPHAAPLSYIQPGATFSESADTNAANTLGGSGSLTSVSRALASVTLQRLWSHFDLAADYIGGFAYYDLAGQGFKALQQMDIEQKISWKRGQFAVRDSFSYLPEGNFGAAYGSLGSQGIESLGNMSFSSFFGGGSLGTLGLAPRIMNIALADVSEYLSPKSAVTAAGGYAFTHFYGNDGLGGSFIGTSQTSAQVGFSHLITTKTQVAMVYGYQGFDFSVFDTAFHTHVIQLMYGHQISGRMDLLIAAGPQFTIIGTPGIICSDPSIPVSNCTSFVEGTVEDTRIGVAGQARLRYRFPKTMMTASYQRFETSGSGLFAGAQTDVARVSAERPLSRVWSAAVDVGYSRNARLQSLNSQQQGTCVEPGQPNTSNLPVCPGINANIYSYGFAGMAVHRAFGHDFHGFASYQFNELWFDNSYCAGLSACSRISNRNVFTFGLDWTPHPIRID